MKNSFVLSLMALGFLTMAYSTPVQAQVPEAIDTAVPAAVVEEDKFSFGKVIAVSEGEITVKEYDFTKDADVETVYTVTAETELGNVNALADLKVGDDIVIDYLDKEGKRVVTTLVKEEKGMEEMPGEADAIVPVDGGAPVSDAVVAPEAAPEVPVTEAPVAEAPVTEAPVQN